MAGEGLRGREISYNCIAERRGEAGRGGGIVVERDDMNQERLMMWNQQNLEIKCI